MIKKTEVLEVLNKIKGVNNVHQWGISISRNGNVMFKIPLTYPIGGNTPINDEKKYLTVVSYAFRQAGFPVQDAKADTKYDRRDMKPSWAIVTMNIADKKPEPVVKPAIPSNVGTNMLGQRVGNNRQSEYKIGDIVKINRWGNEYSYLQVDNKELDWKDGRAGGDGFGVKLNGKSGNWYLYPDHDQWFYDDAITNIIPKPRKVYRNKIDAETAPSGSSTVGFSKPKPMIEIEAKPQVTNNGVKPKPGRFQQENRLGWTKGQYNAFLESSKPGSMFRNDILAAADGRAVNGLISNLDNYTKWFMTLHPYTGIVRQLNIIRDAVKGAGGKPAFGTIKKAAIEIEKRLKRLYDFARLQKLKSVYTKALKSARGIK